MHLFWIDPLRLPVRRSGSARRPPSCTAGQRGVESLEDVVPALDNEIGDCPSERGLVALHAAFRASGGIARQDAIVRRLEVTDRGDARRLQGLVAAGVAFGFMCDHAVWVPMFQFERRDIRIRPGPRQVVAALGARFDGWATAAWFARPNALLKGSPPIAMIDLDLVATVRAARAVTFTEGR